MNHKNHVNSCPQDSTQQGDTNKEGGTQTETDSIQENPIQKDNAQEDSIQEDPVPEEKNIVKCIHCHSQFIVNPTLLRQSEYQVQCSLCHTKFTVDQPRQSLKKASILHLNPTHNSNSILQSIQHEPVTITPTKKNRPKVPAILSLSAIIIIGLLLLSPTTKQYWQTLLNQESLRKMKLLACQILPCQVAPYYDIDQIKIRYFNIAQKNTQRYPTGIIILYNDSSLPQPLPNLSLLYSKDTSLSQHKILTPEEYLIHNNKKVLPPKQSVQLSIYIPIIAKNIIHYAIEITTNK